MNSSLLITVAILWFATAVIGLGWLTTYQAKAGSTRPEVSQWPASAPPLPADDYVLTLFLHPKCPCSRATIADMDRLLAHLPMNPEGHSPRVSVTLFAVLPPGSDDSWLHNPTLELAATLPHAHLLPDPNGVIARSFGARTSGFVTLYNAQGKLLFSGGITPGRSHEGDCAGIDAILECLAGKEPATRHTPTFGCSLFDDTDLPIPSTSEKATPMTISTPVGGPP